MHLRVFIMANFNYISFLNIKEIVLQENHCIDLCKISSLMEEVRSETVAVPCWEINVPAYSITSASLFLL